MKKYTNDDIKKIAIEKYGKDYEMLQGQINWFIKGFNEALSQPTVISSVCCCGILDSERQNVERNLNECIICGRTIKQTDL